MQITQEERALQIKRAVTKIKCEESQLFFTRFFFKQRQSIKFRVNWHHVVVAQIIQELLDGKRGNTVINISPGSSKTEIAVINAIARGLALNPWARFLHISYSDDLALTNSEQARSIVESDEFQAMWPLKIAHDSSAKKKWNVQIDGKDAGGVYAVALGGAITGFRAGRMEEGFQGAIIVDDPLKPKDAFSKTKRDAANRDLVSTVKSRLANPDTPILVIMQRLAEDDPTGFIEKGNIPGKWDIIKIPAIIDEKWLNDNKRIITPEIRAMVDMSERDDKGRFSYWPYKERIKELGEMEKGSGTDKDGSRISRHVFAGQYGQSPTAMGGNLIQGAWFKTWKVLPRLKHRAIYADTANKTAQRNDFSVFLCVGLGEDGKLYLLDQIRGKWESHELKKRAVAFWMKHKSETDIEKMGSLRCMYVEDKASGTGLIQDIKNDAKFPIKGIPRHIDKYTREQDAEPYIENGFVYVPENGAWVNDFISEAEAFTSDDSHAFDDQLDPLFDAIQNELSQANKLKKWENLR